MSDKSRSKIAEQIKKLLALARDPSNEHEAMLAAEKARQLLEQHNLKIGEIELEATPSVESKVEIGARCEAWKWMLARAAAKLLDCEVIRINIMPAWLRRKQITFCGIAQNVEVATLTFAYFRASISHLARRRKLKPRQMSSYKTGAAERIFVEVSISRRQAIAEGEGIVRVGNAVASRHLQQNYPQRTQSKFALATRSSQARALGYLDAGSINLHGLGKHLSPGGAE